MAVLRVEADFRTRAGKHFNIPSFSCRLLYFLERRASQTARLLVGRAEKHLFLTDNDGGMLPLLLQMVADSGDLRSKIPHVLYVEPETMGRSDSQTSSVVADQITELEVEMIKGLNQVPWERVDVSFHKSAQRHVAHGAIQVKTYWLNSNGADVVLHMKDNFLV